MRNPWKRESSDSFWHLDYFLQNFRTSLCDFMPDLIWRDDCGNIGVAQTFLHTPYILKFQKNNIERYSTIQYHDSETLNGSKCMSAFKELGLTFFFFFIRTSVILCRCLWINSVDSLKWVVQNEPIITFCFTGKDALSYWLHVECPSLAQINEINHTILVGLRMHFNFLSDILIFVWINMKWHRSFCCTIAILLCGSVLLASHIQIPVVKCNIPSHGYKKYTLNKQTGVTRPPVCWPVCNKKTIR